MIVQNGIVGGCSFYSCQHFESCCGNANLCCGWKEERKKVSDFNCFSSFESKRNFCAWSGSSVQQREFIVLVVWCYALKLSVKVSREAFKIQIDRRVKKRMSDSRELQLERQRRAMVACVQYSTRLVPVGVHGEVLREGCRPCRRRVL